MATAVLLLGAGALILWAGAELAVRGATGVTRAAGIPAFVVGALLFGVDVEGLGATVTAAGRGETAMAAGEAFGTILFLFAAAFGLALLLAREPIPAPTAPMMAAPAAGVILATAVIADRAVTRFEGIILVAAYAVYVLVVLVEHRLGAEGEGGDVAREVAEMVEEAAPGNADPQGSPSAGRQGAMAVLGLGLVAGGAWLLVGGGVRVLAVAGLSAGFVGAAVLGALTSLDEVLLEVLPVRRGVPELATGNLFGTLAAFTTGVLGLAAVVRPLTLDTGANLAFLAAAALYALVGTVLFVRGRAGRILGSVVLALYLVWLVGAAAL